MPIKEKPEYIQHENNLWDTVIRKSLSEPAQHQGRGKIHNHIHDLWKCPRRLVYDWLYPSTVGYNNITFTHGTWIHNMLNSLWDNAGYGCGTPEIQCSVPELNVMFTMDKLITIDGTTVPIEFKSCSRYVYYDMKRNGLIVNTGYENVPAEAHVLQLTMYVHFKNYPFGLLQYFCKDSGESTVYVIQPNKDIIKGGVDKLNSVNKHVKDGTLPDRWVKKCDECKECEHKDRCW